MLMSQAALAQQDAEQSIEPGAEMEGDQFVNSNKRYQVSMGDMWKIIKQQFSADRQAPTPGFQLPVIELTQDKLVDHLPDSAYRLTHSSVLLRLSGEFILTDPVFSERASPVQWLGPKRFHASPIEMGELPFISAVVISHDHYDHLDKASIKALKKQVGSFVVPLKVGDVLRKWGVDDKQIIELDWWQSVTIGRNVFTATPSQHFSGRGLFDRDERLWASWAIKGQTSNVFFSGDSGYFPGFKTIGERLGPFDLTMIETGAYNELWSDIHMFPEQSVQAHIDLGGRAYMPIHNASFDLAIHDWFEPLERAFDLSAKRGVTMVAPRFGEHVSIAEPGFLTANRRWWQSIAELQVSPSAIAVSDY